MRSGEGVYTYCEKNPEATADVYSGSWLKNEKNGIGKQSYQGVGYYYGYWEKGARHGEGVMTYVNQDVYSGMWANGNKDGLGTYIFQSTGQKYIGSFIKGEMVRGKWLFSNGTHYKGDFDNNKPKGQGEWHFSNGNHVQGTYRQTVKAEDSESDPIKLAWQSVIA